MLQPERTIRFNPDNLIADEMGSHPEALDEALMGLGKDQVAASKHLLICPPCYKASVQPILDLLEYKGDLQPGTRLTEDADLVTLFDRYMIYKADLI